MALDLGALPPDLASRAHAINNLGQVVGVSMPSPSSSFGGDAVFWSGGTLTPFIQNEDPGHIVTSALNDLGQVVGGLFTNAFMWQDGVMTSLGPSGGTYSFAEGINNAGQIVGRSSIAQGPLRAFIFENGQMIDLNSRVVDLSEWEYLSSASDINESGQIVGFGRLRGGFSDNEVFLLTPIPEPSSALLLLAGFTLTFPILCRKRCGQS